jgi:hypothetical protein
MGLCESAAAAAIIVASSAEVGAQVEKAKNKKELREATEACDRVTSYFEELTVRELKDILRYNNERARTVAI